MGSLRRPAVSILLLVALGTPDPAVPAEESGEVPGPAGELFHQDVAWSPDGRWLAFSEYSGGAEYDPAAWGVSVVRPDGSGRRQLLADAQIVTWSPDGARLAVGSRRGGDWDVYEIAFDDAGREGGGPERLTRSTADDRAPAWSPDGRRIAFTSNRDGNTEIYLLALDDEGPPRRLTHHPRGDYAPAWSPEGDRIVFYRESGDAADDIVIRSLGGAEPAERHLTRDPHLDIYPAFLPDGRVGFASRESPDGPSRLAVTDADGAGRHTVGPPAFFARWSPDGGTVAFIAGSWPRSAIYLMASDGSGVRKLVN